MVTSSFEPELKKGSTELLILALVEDRPRHGYEIAKKISERSGGALVFHAASLYPVFYRLERKGWLQGRWLEKAGQRRRRYYRLTSEGRRMLESQRRTWRDFIAAVNRVAQVGPV
ncbi:MAG TPA: PadR family transcriptional regulator [Acidobacteriota bacterium]|nr:PadR family transcriptional regulator [Acidobacteriota bacterium]